MLGDEGQDTFDVAVPGDADVGTAVRPGAVLAGKYRVERTLGRGGMGLVLGATHIHSGELVAIKVLQATALKNKEAVARFEREARAAGKMSGEYAARTWILRTPDPSRGMRTRTESV